MCPVLLTERSFVKATGSSIQSAPVEELLQNNEQQQVVLEAEVSRTLLQIPSRLQLVNAKGYKRPVQKLAWWHQLKRISETCQGLDNWHHILCFASKWSWAHHLGTHNCSNLQTVLQICTTFPGTGTGTLPSCLQHTELCNIQSWFTRISGPADSFCVSWKSLKLAYKEHLIYWRASLPDEGPFSNSQHKCDLHRSCQKSDSLSHCFAKRRWCLETWEKDQRT